MRARAGRISFGGTPPAHGRGWSQRELREINRIGVACGNQFHIELVFGESDESDPWCIVCEREGERVLLHIARIDCCYVIARPCCSTLQRTTSITAATDFALRWLDRELREHFRPGHAANAGRFHIG
jgi:hypothetical protein